MALWQLSRTVVTNRLFDVQRQDIAATDIVITMTVNAEVNVMKNVVGAIAIVTTVIKEPVVMLCGVVEDAEMNTVMRVYAVRTTGITAIMKHGMTVTEMTMFTSEDKHR